MLLCEGACQLQKYRSPNSPTPGHKTSLTHWSCTLIYSKLHSPLHPRWWICNSLVHQNLQTCSFESGRGRGRVWSRQRHCSCSIGPSSYVNVLHCLHDQCQECQLMCRAGSPGSTWKESSSTLSSISLVITLILGYLLQSLWMPCIRHSL